MRARAAVTANLTPLIITRGRQLAEGQVRTLCRRPSPAGAPCEASTGQPGPTCAAVALGTPRVLSAGASGQRARRWTACRVLLALKHTPQFTGFVSAFGAGIWGAWDVVMFKQSRGELIRDHQLKYAFLHNGILMKE